MQQKLRSYTRLQACQMNTPSAAVWLVAATQLVACQARHVSDEPTDLAKVEVITWPVETNRELDILWVIDNSSSMAGEQANLIANFPAFIDALANLPNGLPNLHMGVVSTNGRDVGLSGCTGGGGALLAPAGKAAFISDLLPPGDTTRTTSWEADGYASLADAFSDYANLGTNGCGFEQPFQSVIDAINPATNPGFIRPNAYLAIVFLTDEDDCSGAIGSNALFDDSPSAVSTLGTLSSFRCWEYGVTCDGDAPSNERTSGPRTECAVATENPYTMPLSAVTEALAAVKAKRHIMMATIAGDTDASNVAVLDTPSAWGNEHSPVALAPSCVQPNAGDVYGNADGELYAARPAVRLQALLRYYEQFGTTEQSICEENLTPALTNIGGIVADAFGLPCVDGELTDSDGSAPGLQPVCQVSVVTNWGETNQSETLLPACGAGETVDCWRLVEDPLQCEMGDHWRMEAPLTPTLDDASKVIRAECEII